MSAIRLHTSWSALAPPAVQSHEHVACAVLCRLHKGLDGVPQTEEERALLADIQEIKQVSPTVIITGAGHTPGSAWTPGAWGAAPPANGRGQDQRAGACECRAQAREVAALDHADSRLHLTLCGVLENGAFLPGEHTCSTSALWSHQLSQLPAPDVRP